MVIQLLKRIGSTIFLTRAPAHKMEVMFTHEELISRGFEPKHYETEEVSYTVYKKFIGELIIDITVSETTTVDVGNIDWFPVPNCRTLTDLDQLIKLFTV